MATYLITGANRGLGLEFVRHYSNDPKNRVVALVRNKAAAKKAEPKQFTKPNVHVVEADLTSYDSLKTAAAETSDITGNKLDFVIANAGLVSDWSAFDDMETLGKEPTALQKDLLDSFSINVIGNIHLFNLFLPLVRNGSAKKVIAISTGMADIDLISKYDIEMAGPYSISKAALNTAVAKYSAQCRQEGILFMSISPGVVETGQTAGATDEQLQKVAAMGAKFATYAPHFKGPISTEESVTAIDRVILNASVEGGSGGSFVSHLGTQQWL
ncbi:Hsp70 nucleotide exchange factor FES1 [Purpureocillium lavendulum]|uniref:Hsp70 nucleotide exchange factor FES1 n=1 Tax=Purpureocillium lavendulum TaxID=1247861 RepID=A0AB34FIU7_9HYPO|nr:Hsp70 nucleotide exchange factor FES1 [Purpureocillium lavendulum]